MHLITKGGSPDFEWYGMAELTPQAFAQSFVLVDGEQVDYSWLNDATIEEPTAT